jgi:hypothetical protein
MGMSSRAEEEKRRRDAIPAVAKFVRKRTVRGTHRPSRHRGGELIPKVGERQGA